MLSSKQMTMARAHARVAPASFPKGRRALVVVANEKQGKGGEEGGKKFDNTVYGTVAKNANFMILGAAITKAGLDGALSGAGPFTAFVPNDDAFAAACKSLGITKLALMDLPNLADILKYHVVAGNIMSKDLVEGAEVTTLQGQTIKITLAGGAKVNGIKVKKADVRVSNGVLHVLEGVLLPK